MIKRLRRKLIAACMLSLAIVLTVILGGVNLMSYQKVVADADMVLALLGVIVLATYSPQNGVIVLILAFLISPFGLPKLALWLLGQIQNLKFAIQDLVYG